MHLEYPDVVWLGMSFSQRFATSILICNKKTLLLKKTKFKTSWFWIWKLYWNFTADRCPANLALWQRLKLLTYFFFSKSFVITIKECCQSCGSLLHWGAEFGPKNLQNSPFWPKMNVPLGAIERILILKFPLYHDWTCYIWWWTRYGLKKTITLNKQKKFLGHPKWPW